MSQSTPASKTRSSQKSIRWWLIFFIFATPVFIVSSAVLVFRIGYTLRESSGKRAMATEIEKLVSEGLPTDDQAIDDIYCSRTSDDHVDDWQELFSKIDSREFLQDGAGVPWHDPKVEDERPFVGVANKDWKYAEACEAFTTKHQELIAEIHRLAAQPEPCRFPIVFQSTDTLLPEVQISRNVARLLMIDAHVGIHARDPKRVAQDIESIYSLSRQVDAVPFAVSRLVGIALRGMALQILQRSIAIDLLTAEQLTSIDGLLVNYCELGSRWQETMQDELGNLLPTFFNPSRALNRDKLTPARGHDAVFFIAMMRRAIQMETGDWPTFYRSIQQLEADMKADRLSMLQSIDHLLSHTLAPAFSIYATTWINDAQLHRLARLAIASRLQMNKDPALPASVELIPESAKLHPFGNAPFGFQSAGDRIVLWGFQLSDKDLQTPAEPPKYDPELPNTDVNERWVWEVVRP